VKSVVSAVVTYHVQVTNQSTADESLTLSSLVDTIQPPDGGNPIEVDLSEVCGLTGDGGAPAVIEPGDSFDCEFTSDLLPGETADAVTGTVSDNEGGTIYPSDDAWVSLQDEAPAEEPAPTP
jgi:hypothetical protein